MESLTSLVSRVRNCTICEKDLPYGPNPVFQIDRRARILIAGQAPGRKVHDSGVPFDDASGERLREWLGVTRDTFYDPKKFAILPIGFCYPGRGRSGDLPPRKECEPAWRKQLQLQLTNLAFTIVLGKYAQAYYFDVKGITLTDLVQSWRTHLPDKMALPHPSPRNNIWLKKNPWFETELLPELKRCVSTALTESE